MNRQRVVDEIWDKMLVLILKFIETRDIKYLNEAGEQYRRDVLNLFGRF